MPGPSAKFFPEQSRRVDRCGDSGATPLSTLSMAEERAQGVRARRYRHPRPPATTLYVEESVYVCNGDVGDRRFFDA
jgi:hypothetical protein